MPRLTCDRCRFACYSPETMAAHVEQSHGGQPTKPPPATPVGDVAARVADRVAPDWRDAMAAAEADPDAAKAAQQAEAAEFGAGATLSPGHAPHIPKRHRAASLETFDTTWVDRLQHRHPEQWRAWQDELIQARDAVRQWVGLVQREKSALLALVGPPGNGKSTLLYAAVNALTAARRRVFCRPWYRLANDLRWGGRSAYTPQPVQAWELRNQLWDAPVAAVDEVGVTSGTTFDETELGQFAKNAWDEGASLILTTNVNPLSSLLGAAGADRFVVVTITAPSYRQFG